jgi:uncharacterized protein
MLLIEVAEIPPEGLELDTPLEAGEVHLEGEESFALEAGGRLTCRLDRGDEGSVHVQGRLQARLGVDCSRCLDRFSYAVDQPLDLFYLPHRADAENEEEDEVELADRDMVVAYYDRGRLDLGGSVREQFFLSLPMKRLCRESCQGLCPVCGKNRNLDPCTCPAPAAFLSPFATLLPK